MGFSKSINNQDFLEGWERIMGPKAKGWGVKSEKTT